MKTRITPTGKITVPAAIRSAAGLVPGTEVELQLDGESVRIVRVDPRPERGRGAMVVEHLRRYPGQAGLTTDEIMALSRGED
jgi:AbrB family looped-hinge helix DNA binding protein